MLGDPAGEQARGNDHACEEPDLVMLEHDAGFEIEETPPERHGPTPLSGVATLRPRPKMAPPLLVPWLVLVNEVDKHCYDGEQEQAQFRRARLKALIGAVFHLTEPRCCR